MRIADKEEFYNEKSYFAEEMDKGALFIYPTDTIYGMGCDALNTKSVEKIRKIKLRNETPFSVIAPSKKWIEENCIVENEGRKWIEKLPGQYTLIFKTRKKCVSEAVNKGLGTLGVRIPNHWIKDFVNETGVPIVTTSVNKSGSDFMTSMKDLDAEIKNNVDFILDEGEIKGKPSRIVDLRDKAKIIERG